MPHVILINVHGGYPTAMVKRSFVNCRLCATRKNITHERPRLPHQCSYPSSTTLHGRAFGTMSDSVWHAWVLVQHATRSIFTCSSSTAIGHGCLGLWPGPAARPSTHMHTDAHALGQTLSMYGIDEYDSQDPAYVPGRIGARQRRAAASRRIWRGTRPRQT